MPEGRSLPRPEWVNTTREIDPEILWRYFKKKGGVERKTAHISGSDKRLEKESWRGGAVVVKTLKHLIPPLFVGREESLMGAVKGFDFSVSDWCFSLFPPTTGLCLRVSRSLGVPGMDQSHSTSLQLLKCEDKDRAGGGQEGC